MSVLRQIFLLSIALGLAVQTLFAQVQKSDKLAEQIAGLPWDKDEAAVDVSPDPKAQLIVVAHYSNPSVVTDTDTGYIHLYALQWSVAKNGKLISGMVRGSAMQDKCRDGMDRWCNGAGNFENVSKNGFDYHLNLDWQIDKEKAKSFNETFHCQWVKEQTFKKDGFTIVISTALKN